ncbi:hypothetical protein ACFQ02_00430 [Seminibacterium arietis]|uniref:Transposase n=1 Tax=Seminibacterium arietis TaxID=1173502 RepID=A0ABW3I5Y7_9PAST
MKPKEKTAKQYRMAAEVLNKKFLKKTTAFCIALALSKTKKIENSS